MVKAGFIFLVIILAIILSAGAFSVADRAFSDARQRVRFKIRTVLILLIWLAYVSAISLTGIFTNATMPPRIPLLLVLPAFIFTAYFFITKKLKPVIATTPASWPVYFQVFRVVVELLIWGCATRGILPKAASFEGYNFDIVVGITAPLIGYLSVSGGRVKNKALLLAWNIAGLITLTIVVFIIMRHAYSYTQLGYKESILPQGFGLFPYTFLAAFLMPLAVFMHIFSFVKIRQSA